MINASHTLSRELQIFHTFYPFERVHTHQWGTYRRLAIANVTGKTRGFWWKFQNLQGFPLKLSLFPRYPTCMEAHELPEVARAMYLMKESWRSANFGGVDGLMVQSMAKTLNFSADIVVPTGIDFGFRADNGTFFGRIMHSAKFGTSQQKNTSAPLPQVQSAPYSTAKRTHRSTGAS